jgi:hypothetical protein
MVGALVSGAGTAHADEPADAPVAAPLPAPTDVVRLKNGGLLRGSIAELVPGDSVTIVTVAGQTRTFPMAEVAYAGPNEKDTEGRAAEPSEPAAAAAAASDARRETPVSTPDSRPYVTVNAAQAHLHLTSEPPGLTFHRQVASASGRYGTGVQGYERLCTTPCDVTMPAGTETLALSTGNEPAVPAEPVTFRGGASRVSGTLESNAQLRAGGIVVMLFGAAIGAGMEIGAVAGVANGNELSWPLLVGGLAVFAGGMGAGAAMMTTRDDAAVQVRSSWRSIPMPRSTGFAIRGQL